VNSVKAMRGCIWLGKRHGAVRARRVSKPIGARTRIFHRTRAERNLQNAVGVDPQKFLAGIGDQAIKDQLKAKHRRSDGPAAASARRPFFVGKTDMYFGNDRFAV